MAQNLLKSPQSIQVTPPNTTVQRIKQLAHPVGRGKKKALLAHIIQTHNWSQVLVFTRTKFGANSVAEYLNKQGISAMPLHGNKSQSARTQALEGFKSGDVRALVATDIAARGIDIDELPHVVNYEIPNVSEDYVHRIGRTGRAGSDGEAVSLVSLDEEGFMRDIEHFTHQTIEVQVVEGFGPEPDERAEPIAMGRQTIWGGIGRAPSRDVMAAAAKAARFEMMERIKDKKLASPNKARPSQNNGPTRNSRPSRPNGDVNRERVFDPNQPASPYARGPHPGSRDAAHPNPRPSGPGRGGPPRGGNDSRAGFKPRGPGRPGPSQPREGAHDANHVPHAPRAHMMDEDYQPRENAHLGTHNGVNAFGHKNQNKGTSTPDPTRTSVDLMSERRGGGGNRPRGPKPAGGGFGGKRSGGGGGSRGGFGR